MEGRINKERGLIRMNLNKKHVYDYFESAGLYFSTEIITRYLLSLKTKPFVILTGISGTGKTKIAQVFADYMCQDDNKKERIAFVSVRSDWMDNKGLLGFYNLLDEKYHTTAVLKILLRAKDDPNKPYFVILDEMNLAKVEQYFSDFLSIMESRTSSNPSGEPLRLHNHVRVSSPDGIEIPGSITIPPNIFFTGTVNVDETTYMFSPKVLDRANVIEFNEINLEHYSNGSPLSDDFILRDFDVREKLVSHNNHPFPSMEDYKKAKEIMKQNRYPENVFQELTENLSPYNLHFGYRVVNEVSRFMVYAHEMVEKVNPKDIFDIQILQKILPKFHGSQAKLEEPLKKLKEFCKKSGFARSETKIEKMLDNLKKQGYTSFIE